MKMWIQSFLNTQQQQQQQKLNRHTVIYVFVFLNRHIQDAMLSSEGPLRIPIWRRPFGCAVPSASHSEVNYLSFLSSKASSAQFFVYIGVCLLCVCLRVTVLFVVSCVNGPGRSVSLLQSCHYRGSLRNNYLFSAVRV